MTPQDGDDRDPADAGGNPQLSLRQLVGELYRYLRGKEPKHDIEPRNVDEKYNRTSADDDLPHDIATLADLQSLAFDEFEQLVADLYERRGYEVSLTPPGPDDGLDVIARKTSDSVGIQAKRYQEGNNVTARTIRATHGAISQRDLSRAAVATTSQFSAKAEQAASELNMELMTGQDIMNELRST